MANSLAAAAAAADDVAAELAGAAAIEPRGTYLDVDEELGALTDTTTNAAANPGGDEKGEP